MAPERTPEGKWTLYEIATGTARVCWPVDGREMLATGAYTADPPTQADEAEPAPVAPGSEHPDPPSDPEAPTGGEKPPRASGRRK